ncbi:interleukin-37 [Echinops telfairi]|uniref:Interleukin-37 n=1 Tax=Echinops telfairi TaxID=9371 RepID=A0AC55CU64_ECHTE|nr:interleukin-37 [Echinops telfairi]
MSLSVLETSCRNAPERHEWGDCISDIQHETFFVLASHLLPASEEKGSLIFLGVSEGELWLCCDKDNGQSQPKPTVTTAEVLEKGRGGHRGVVTTYCPSTYQHQKNPCKDLTAQKEPSLTSFIFYKRKVGSRYTLESAAHSKWFLCTSSSSDAPVGMTKTPGKNNHTEFSFAKLSQWT